MLSQEQAAVLMKYYQTIQLSSEQKDRLIHSYWGASPDARREIARAYANLFATDSEFVQRLLLFHDLRQRPKDSGVSALGANGNGEAAGRDSCGSSSETGSPTNAVNSGNPMLSPTGSAPHYGFPTVPRITHSQMLLRTAIQDQFPKLTGAGPFVISFGLVRTEAERKEVVDLYSSQFEQPDPPELQRLVSLPQSLSTRTRRRISGSYTWYVRSHSTGEMVCGVTITVHPHQTHQFIEMPLFATAAGYKHNGFGRLLNAALAQWCANAGFEFVMISADVQAIPFWKHLGYDIMSKSERSGIAFYYEHECYKFSGAEPMIGYCFRRKRPRDASQQTMAKPLSEQSVEEILKRMFKFVVTGPLELPDP